MATIRSPEDVDPRVIEAHEATNKPFHQIGDRVQFIGTGIVGTVIRTSYDESFDFQLCYVAFDDIRESDSYPYEPYVEKHSAPTLFPVPWGEVEPKKAWGELPKDMKPEEHPIRQYEYYRAWKKTGKYLRNKGIEIRYGDGLKTVSSEVFEYDRIVRHIISHYKECRRLPHTKEECESIVRKRVYDHKLSYAGSGGPYLDDIKDDIHSLVKGFYTDFENRIW